MSVVQICMYSVCVCACVFVCVGRSVWQAFRVRVCLHVRERAADCAQVCVRSFNNNTNYADTFYAFRM